jgi:hypothetical protein
MNYTLLYYMEYSIPIPRGKSGWNGMEFGIFHVESSKYKVRQTSSVVISKYYWPSGWA